MQNHPIFRKYTREWLSEHTGYTRSYLNHVANGSMPLTRNFMEKVSFKLKEPIENLFLLDPSSIAAGKGDNVN